MTVYELIVLAVGLSMDAFAVSVCIGLTLPKATFPKAVTVGLYFGVFQAGMPLLGYMTARLFADRIIAYSHWIAFGLLGFLGVRMIMGSLQKEEARDSYESQTSLNPKKMLPLAIATSIDALAVGVSFAFLDVGIIPAISFIGVTTLILSMVGVKVGNIFGLKFKSKAEFIGGAILVLIGVKILLENLEIIKF